MASMLGTLHTMWGSTSALTALVPATHVFTGRVPPQDQVLTPYVRIDKPSGGSNGRSNKSMYRNEEVAFHIWTDTYDQGESIHQAVENAFANQSFTYDDGLVLDVIFENHSVNQIAMPTYTAWETILTFSFKTQQARVH